VKDSVKREKTNKIQQSDVYYQLLAQHVSGIIMPIFQENKDLVLLQTVYCAGSAGCGWQRPTTAANHIQQNQSSTPYAVTQSLIS
jgi:hypothetical protein